MAFAEIEKFPSAVLAHHYPHVPNLGDITKFKEWPRGRIDLVVGGTPCQAFSVAGLRKGLEDARGNLTLTYCAILDRYLPQWFVWENVPGVLSVDGGRAFGSLLGAVAKLGYGFAYRVLDAQYVRVDSFARAVPQRRRRVFVVGHLGDWRRAAAVLFERESLLGDSSPRRQAGEAVAGTIGASLARCSADEGERGNLIAKTLVSGGHSNNPLDENLVAHSLRAEGFDASQDGTGRGTPLVPVVADTLTAYWERSKGAKAGNQVGLINPIIEQVAQQWAVRRLTPRECERLQGFPDNYTAIPKAADGPRYKALGNSMAVNVMRWIGQRVAMVRAAVGDACA